MGRERSCETDQSVFRGIVGRPVGTPPQGKVGLGPLEARRSVRFLALISIARLIQFSGGDLMQERIAKVLACAILAPVAMLSAVRPAQAEDASTPYPRMAPLDQYLMS